MVSPIGQFSVNYESIWSSNFEVIIVLEAMVILLSLLLSLGFISCTQSLQCYYCDIQHNVTCPGLMR